jgi:hypothetical protein
MFSESNNALLDFQLSTGSSGPNAPADRITTPEDLEKIISGYVYDSTEIDVSEAVQQAKNEKLGRTMDRMRFYYTAEKAEQVAKSSVDVSSIRREEFVDISTIKSWFNTIPPTVRSTLSTIVESEVVKAEKWMKEQRDSKKWTVGVIMGCSSDVFVQFVRTHVDVPHIKSKGNRLLTVPVCSALVLERYAIKSYRRRLVEQVRGAWIIRNAIQRAFNEFLAARVG